MADLRYDHEDVSDIQNRLAQHVEAIERLLASVEHGVLLVQDGAWVGMGAQAFQDEYFGEVVPRFQTIMNMLDSLRAGLQDASGVMADANDTVRQEAANAVWKHSIF